MAVSLNNRSGLQRRLGFESLISDLSAQFVQTASLEVDTAIEAALFRVMEFFQCDRCGLLGVRREHTWVSVTHASYAADISQVPGDINLAALFPWAYDLMVVRDQPNVVARLEDVPTQGAQDVRSWKEMGVRSTLGIPIPSENTVRHIIVIECLREDREWPRAFIPRLRVLGEIFVNALERKRVDEAHRRNEARLSLAADSADAGLWEMELPSRRIWATPKTYELYGLRRSDSVDFASFLNMVHAEDQDRVRAEVQRSIELGVDLRSEHRIVLPGGIIRWVTARGRIHERDGLPPDRLTGISIDITARKESEMALRAATEEIQRLKDRLHQENSYLRQEVKHRSDHFAIVGQSRSLRQVLYQIEQVAPTNSVALIEGETGTGKELAAHAIHEASPRRARPMVCINCGAIPGSLIESELFGREKGAYTGALSKQIGRFELADGSTLLLDEVAELPLDLQVKLLRVLQEQKIERLGSPTPISVDVRIIAATNRDLVAAVREGRFRQDLYYRLSVFPIRIPPLRDRMEDMSLLAWTFVEEFGKSMGKTIDSIAHESMHAMEKYSWPGNIRELRNVIERAMILAKGPQLRIELPSAAGIEVDAASLRMSDVESAHIRSVLDTTRGRIRGKKGAAELLGLKPSTLESRMRKYGIRRVRP